ncbi:hypothetical protein [Clostridium tyrobutyricum]|uniref:hypothetical protein n=1 Tax=Clostridium tyrobutyricum TaxID=1519 RepID=UPI002011045B|nr:hypothetical protein [Clostridium tyrobutyricum]
MEDWLFKKDDYIPKGKSDKFIDKSIFSILKVLSHIKRKDKFKNGFLYFYPCQEILHMYWQ